MKSVEAIAPVHKMQVPTYLRLADKRLGLLINFDVALIKDGIVRIANHLEEPAAPRALPPDPRTGGAAQTRERSLAFAAE